MVPSALRTLSVVVLLGAVSGTVIATVPQSGGSPSGAVRTAEQDLSGRIQLTGFSTTRTGAASEGGVNTASPKLTGTLLAATPLAGLHTTAQFQTADRLAQSQVAAQTAAEDQAARQAAARKKAEAAKKKAAEKKAAAERREKARKKASRNSPRSARSIAKLMVAERGWKSGQFSCLVKLWDKESGWRHTAANPSSSAYGIPQALPGSKMSSAGKDWRTNPATQIKWGLRYIADRYGSPCGAWAHSRAHNWY